VALPAVVPLLFEWQALALREADFDTAATTVLAAMAARLGAVRVSLLARRSAREPARWLACSDGIDQDARVRTQRDLLNAADEVLDRDGLIECPWPPGVQAAPAVALSALLRAGEVPAAVGMPFEMPDGARAAMVFELRQTPGIAERQLARDAALFVGPVLMLKAQADAGWLDRARQVLRPYDSRRRARRTSVAWAAGGVVVAAALVAACWPSTHHVVAPARLDGHGQRVVPAPMDGFLQSVRVRPGERVKAGQVLALLDDKDAQLQAERTLSERRQTERQYLDALTREDAAATEIARARLEQARAADDLAQSRLSLSRLVAPFDGVVISGDLVAMVGSPVRRGQELMVVAPSQTWRIVAEVDEGDIGHVQPGQNARMLLAGAEGATASFAVTRISPVAQPAEGRNVFEVEGLVAATPGSGLDGLRPGQRGIVRIEAGERPPIAVWWERASQALRRLLWTLMA
jgi:multidrug resistance efflux pump